MPPPCRPPPVPSPSALMAESESSWMPSPRNAAPTMCHPHVTGDGPDTLASFPFLNGLSLFPSLGFSCFCLCQECLSHSAWKDWLCSRLLQSKITRGDSPSPSPALIRSLSFVFAKALLSAMMCMVQVHSGLYPQPSVTQMVVVVQWPLRGPGHGRPAATHLHWSCSQSDSSWALPPGC